MAQPGERVWLADTDTVWIGAKVEARTIDTKSGNVVLLVKYEHDTRGEPHQLVFASEDDVSASVKRRNEGPTTRVDDLIRLPHLHEPAILEVLQRRSAVGLIYTNVGAILLAVNPFKRVPGLYSDETVQLHSTTGAARDSNPDAAPPAPPHAFAVADAAYRAMRRSQLNRAQISNQAILISGESGAG